MTDKLYYADPYTKAFDARVLSCTEKNGSWQVVLDRTAFYPEGGGQPSDLGSLNNVGVTDVHEKDGVIIHCCTAPIEEGSMVHGELDWHRRFDHMQQHSGEHIVSGIICSMLHCDNVGFHMGSDSILIDYNASMSDEQYKEVEARANRYIWENHDIEISWPSPEELSSINYRSKKELSGAVRIVSFPGADCCACCGTHVTSSGSIGLVKLISKQRFHEGVRLELLCGERAFNYLSRSHEQNAAIGSLLSAKQTETFSAAEKLTADLNSERLRADINEESYFNLLACSYESAVNPVILSDKLSSDSTRKLCSAVARHSTGTVTVFSGREGEYKYAVFAKDDNLLKELVVKINSSLNGRGGGRGGMAQGSISCSPEQLNAFISSQQQP